MKIRTDFVTNSSSSSFTVVVTVVTKETSLRLSTYRSFYSEENNHGSFEGDLRYINAHLGSVRELAAWLADATKESSWPGRESLSFSKRKREFIKNACEKIKTVRDIEEITVTREYSAWGECAELIADGDQTLQEFARRYNNSSNGLERDRIAAEMATYINTATYIRGDSFGRNAVDSRYNWGGCSRSSIESMVKALCDYNYQNSVSGVEYQKLNLRTGEYFNNSEYSL